MIEADGATQLVRSANAYLLQPTGGSSGPQLTYGGAVVTVNQFAGWTPIGAEQTATGYKVVWRFGAADQFTVWTTDSNGNWLSQSAVVPGSDPLVASLEPGFDQDLNGVGGITSTTMIEADGATQLVRSANAYPLQPTGGSSGPQLTYGGAVVTVNQFAGWTPIGAEQTATGYKVVWQFGTDQYTVWTTDSNGNWLSQSATVSGVSPLVASLEPGFDQDLNSSGAITSTTTIEADGATQLVRSANAYLLQPTGGSSGPQLTYGGAVVTVNQFAGWTPIGAEQTATGYKVAWQFGSDQYVVWNTDGNGNWLSQSTSMSRTSFALESMEAGFAQDLNTDGTVGVVTAAVETAGFTSLTKVANGYFLYPHGNSSGPQLNYGGAAVTAGQFGAWTPIAAERTASGYEVAWQFGSTDQYIVWSTDSGGNFRSNIVSDVTSATMKAFERSFGQDFDSDGSVAPATVIESIGATTLVKVANGYFLYPTGGTGSLGIPLTSSGGLVTAGQFGAWTPIGAEQTASGYNIAWKFGSADQYTVWSTDSSGSFVSNTPTAFGASSALKVFEAGLQQDLNSDGMIGVPTSAFNITIDPTTDARLLPYVTAAAHRWEQVILGDIPDVNSSQFGFIDDLKIYVYSGALGGTTLAESTRDETRPGSLLPDHGTIRVNSFQLDKMLSDGTLYYAMLHEIGHLLGLSGTIWDLKGLTNASGYIGQHGLYAYQLLSGNPSATFVPLDGTSSLHWSEAVFGNELMTGTMTSAPDPLSIMTIGALQDLGYTVNYSAADSYTLPAGHLMASAEYASTQTQALQAASASVGEGPAGFDSTVEPLVLANDEIGNGGSGAGGTALLANYMASTFVTPAGPGIGGDVASPTAYDSLLAHPVA